MKAINKALSASNIFAMLFVSVLVLFSGCSETSITDSQTELKHEVSSTPNPKEQSLFWTCPILSVQAFGEHYLEKQTESPYIKAGLPVLKICFEGSVQLGNSSYIPMLTVYRENELLFTESNVSNLNRYREITLDANQCSQLQIKASLWCDGKGDCTSASLILSNIKVYIIN